MIKHWMRIAQKRTIDEISRYLGELIQTFSQTNAKTTSPTLDALQ
jgi:hypothetical protein